MENEIKICPKVLARLGESHGTIGCGDCETCSDVKGDALAKSVAFVLYGNYWFKRGSVFKKLSEWLSRAETLAILNLPADYAALHEIRETLASNASDDEKRAYVDGLAKTGNYGRELVKLAEEFGL